MHRTDVAKSVHCCIFHQANIASVKYRKSIFIVQEIVLLDLI